MITVWTMKHDKREVMEILGAVNSGGDAARLVNNAVYIKPRRPRSAWPARRARHSIPR